MPGATRNSERVCVLADGWEFVSAAQQCGLGKRACANAADDVWVQRDPVSGMWLGKRGRGPEYQQVIVRAATRGPALRARFHRLGALGEVAAGKTRWRTQMRPLLLSQRRDAIRPTTAGSCVVRA